MPHVLVITTSAAVLDADRFAFVREALNRFLVEADDWLVTTERPLVNRQQVLHPQNVLIG